MSYAKFVSIFKTARVESTPIKVISDPVTVEIVKEARQIMLSPIRHSVWSTDSGGQAPLGFTPLALDPETYHIVLYLKLSYNHFIMTQRKMQTKGRRVYGIPQARKVKAKGLRDWPG